MKKLEADNPFVLIKLIADNKHFLLIVILTLFSITYLLKSFQNKINNTSKTETVLIVVYPTPNFYAKLIEDSNNLEKIQAAQKINNLLNNIFKANLFSTTNFSNFLKRESSLVYQKSFEKYKLNITDYFEINTIKIFKDNTFSPDIYSVPIIINHPVDFDINKLISDYLSFIKKISLRDLYANTSIKNIEEKYSDFKLIKVKQDTISSKSVYRDYFVTLMLSIIVFFIIIFLKEFYKEYKKKYE